MRARSVLRFAAFGLGLLSAMAEDDPNKVNFWPQLEGNGVVPYHQLTVDDFVVRESKDSRSAFFVRAAIEPRYYFMLKAYNGFVFAYVSIWQVYSGLNAKESWRQRDFKEMKAALPYAQALLDLNEINARKLAALKAGELPSARGDTQDEARAKLESSMLEFLQAKYAANQKEMDAFIEATEHGTNRQKTRKLAAAIKERLKNTPATTTPLAAPEPVPNAMPSSAATPAAAPPSVAPSPVRNP